MQTKNMSMEFTIKQSNQIKQINDMVKLCKLKSKCEELKGEFDCLFTEKTESLSKREKLVEHLSSLQGDIEVERSKEFSLQEKIEAAKRSFFDYKNDYLQNICLLLGYQITKFELVEENTIQITLHYRDICYVTYSEKDQLFELLEIFPQHTNFSQIHDFLQSCQDLRGLLTSLRRFFDFAIECKEKQESVD